MTGLAALGAALLADDAIAVLSTPAGSGLADGLAAEVGAARVFAHSRWRAALARPDRVHLALDRTDSDVPDRRAALWPGAGAPLLRRGRRIDTLYGDRRIGLIMLTDPDAGTEVLDGATMVLGRDRPAVVLGPGQDTPALRAMAAAALPTHRVVAFSAGGCVLAPPGAAVPDMIDHAPAVTVAFDARLACAGLHPPEHDAPRGGRWTGAGVATWFLMPRPGAGPWRLRLDVADWADLLGGFPVLVDGTVLAPAVLGGMSVVYGPFDLAPVGGAVCVRPLPPPAVRDMRRGPRRIGVRLLRAHLFRVG